MEFAGPAPLGPFATLAAEMPLRKANDVKQVEPGAKAGNTTGDTRREHDNSARTEEARDIAALRREAARRDLPAGPPPSFEISQLEIDADIQRIIARVEAARTQAREADALKADALSQERVAEAEIAALTKTAAAPEAAAGAGPEATAPGAASPPGTAPEARTGTA